MVVAFYIMKHNVHTIHVNSFVLEFLTYLVAWDFGDKIDSKKFSCVENEYLIVWYCQWRQSGLKSTSATSRPRSFLAIYFKVS